MINNQEWINNNDNTYYNWDASIGKYGGFHHKNSNGDVSTQEIELNNIGEISKCSPTVIYSHINNCNGLNNTTIDLISDIPKGSKFGWDRDNLAWVYYLNNDVYPIYFCKKVESF